MAIPPRRWVGYALLAAGLSLLFDTLTFLRTNWSPLHIPMFAANELALGYLLAVVGVVLLSAPTLIRLLDRYAPDVSMKTGAELAPQSVENHVPARVPPSAKSLLVRKVVSWIIVAVGVLVGFLGLFISENAWLPDRATDPYWYKRLIGLAGFVFLGLTLVAGSLTTRRSRRRAGLIFLLSTPIIAFCLSYPDVGFSVLDKTGNGVFYWPFLWVAIGLSLLFFVPLAISLYALPNKKRALYLFLISVVVVSPVFIRSQWSASLIPRLAGWSAPTVLFGLFWLGTEALGWRPLVEPRQRSPIRRVLAVVAVCVLVAGMDVVATLALAVWQSSLNGPDCGGRQLFSQPAFPGHAVFAARLVRTGHKVHAIGDSKKWTSDWAVGIVQEKFWGLPSSWPRVVLLTNGIFWEGETYFIDGHRAHGFPARFLPIIEAGPCSRTRPVEDAIVDLRILREKSTSTGSRVVGFVQQGEPFRPWPSPPVPHTPLAGVRIDLAGSAGTTEVAVTDQRGIYEIDGLTPDDYTLTLELPDTQSVVEDAGPAKERQKISRQALVDGRLIERDFHVVWNGTIEGIVRDLAGHPAHPQLSLRNPDGTNLGPGIRDSTGTYDDGSYRFEQVSPGRYVIMVDPDGPGEGWPYEPQYYPSATQIGGARVFEIGQGQHIKNIDFAANSLAERKVHIRVTWPDGRVVYVAAIHVAYEHTQEYERPRGTSFVAMTDHDGEAVVGVFGTSRIRIYAEGSVNDLKGPPFYSSRYSVPLEFEAHKVPDKLDLVLTEKKLPGGR
jgi:hypothetical protein